MTTPWVEADEEARQILRAREKRGRAGILGSHRSVGGPLASVAPASGFRSQSLRALLSDPAMTAPIPYLVPGIIPAGAVVLLYGSPKVGKTSFAASLCAEVARGGSFLGRQIQPSAVLYVDMERSRRMTAHRLGEPFGDNLPPDNLRTANGRPSVDELRHEIREHGFRAVVLDTLLRLTELGDENSAAEVRSKLAPWVDLAHAEDVTLILLHHDRKGGGDHGAGARGSNNIVGTVDVALHLKREAGEGASNRRRLEAVSNYDGVEPSICFERVDGHFRAAPSPAQERQERVLRQLRGSGPQTTPNLAEALGEPRSNIDVALEALQSAGLVRREGKGVRGSPLTFHAILVSSSPLDSIVLEETGIPGPEGLPAGGSKYVGVL